MPSAILALNLSWSDGKNVTDLSGVFADQSVSGGDGLLFGGNAFEGNSADGKVVGGGFTIGVGAGYSLDIGLSNTWMDVRGDNGGGGW